MPRKGQTARRNPRSVLNKGGGYYPPCFDSHVHYEHWRHLMQVSGEHRGSGYCLDCTPTCKTKMMAQSRCIHPETKFVVRRSSVDPQQIEMIGVSSDSVFWARISNGEFVIDGARNEKDQQSSEG